MSPACSISIPIMTALPGEPAVGGEPGQRFNYSSGTAVLISKIWMDRIGDRRRRLPIRKLALFGPLGMSSAVLEVDARGTFAGSSYLYATARDWARFGQFLLQDGVWNGQRLLPEGFVAAVRTPTRHRAANTRRRRPGSAAPGGDRQRLPVFRRYASGWKGHDGQSVAIVPSANLVVVRLGLTPSWLRYRPQVLVKEILAAAFRLGRGNQ